MEKTEAITLTNMCMILDSKGNVLVEDKKTKTGHGLIFPGGHVEYHESIVDSVIREVYEETGLKINNLKLCGIKDWIEINGSRYMVFLYKTNTFEGTISSSNEGNVFWMPIEQLKNEMTLWHLDKMLHIFEGDNFTELYFPRKNNDEIPELK